MYLFYEFGFDLNYDESLISDEWPCILEYLDTFTIRKTTKDIYHTKFSDNDYFVISGSCLSIMPASCITLKELYLYEIGADWIHSQDPIDLNLCIIGDHNIPSSQERRKQIAMDAKKFFNYSNEPNILIGLYFPQTREYLALVQYPEETAIAGSKFTVRNIPFRDLSPYSRLAIGIGKIIDSR